LSLFFFVPLTPNAGDEVSGRVRTIDPEKHVVDVPQVAD